ncbi:hypothetical protein ACOMHN_016277 [Nucella lapillus]
MAKLNAGGCDAARVSPDFSDDEVFEKNRVWRPLRFNGPSSEVAHQTLQVVPLDVEHEHDTNKSASATSSNHGSCQTVYDADERVWANSVSSQNFTTNENNHWPGGVRSQVIKSESSEHQREGAAAERASVALQYRRHQLQLERQHSIVDGLLFEIYDRWHGHRADSFDSDTFTECSSTSEVFHGRWDSSYETAAEQERHERQFSRSFLETQSMVQLRRLVHDMQRGINQMSGRLVRQLKRRDRHLARLARHSDVVTAILQAASLKRQIDTRMKFSVTPAPGQSAFDQWKDAMKAVNRLPMGLPPEFRKKVWLSLADHYIRKLKIDWHKTVRLAFNERSNPDDDKLGMQIVKDLHRTGCSSFSGQDNEEDRAVLKRVLLAYARWNKRIGYCQGFNVIAALLLNVMERKEDDALKVMIYLIDHVLPESYFDNNLRALSVDMAVFRDLLRLTLPTLSRHLDRLQHAAQDVNTGACYEPPLTNVFTMQWFLTLFATCLPKEVVLRVWDAILLEGSEVLLRTALCLWGKLARRIMKVDSADEFYSLMGELSSHMMEGTVFNSDDMIKAIYAIAPFPFPQLMELREKYTYNIRPFSSANPTPGRKASRMAKAVLYSDEDELDEEEMRALTGSFPGIAPMQVGRGKGTDISVVGPGAYGADSELVTGSRDSVYMERMSTDITALKMQYDKVRQRQRQAHVIIAGAAASAKKPVEVKPKTQAPVLVPKIETPLAMNHLFVGKVQGGRNRLVTHGPRIASTYTPHNNTLTKQLEAVAAAQAVSRSKRSPAKQSSAAPLQQGEDNKPLQACPTTGEEEKPQGEKPQDSPLEDLATDMVTDTCEEAPTAGEESALGAADMDTDCASVKDQGCGKETLHPDQSVPSTDNDVPCMELSAELSTAPSQADEVDNQHSSGDDSVHPVVSPEPSEEEEEVVKSPTFSLESGGDGEIELCQVEVENSEQDSGIVLSSSSLDGSGESSPVKKAQRPVSIQLRIAGPVHSSSNLRHHWLESYEHSDSNSLKSSGTMGSTNSAPIGSSSGHMTLLSVLAPATTPTHSQRSSSTTPIPSPATVSPLSPSHPSLLSSPMKSGRPFNPFPVKHVNTNRAKTGLKLGLYTPSTLEHIQGQLLGGLVARKARNASS